MLSREIALLLKVSSDIMMAADMGEFTVLVLTDLPAATYYPTHKPHHDRFSDLIYEIPQGFVLDPFFSFFLYIDIHLDRLQMSIMISFITVCRLYSAALAILG